MYVYACIMLVLCMHVLRKYVCTMYIGTYVGVSMCVLCWYYVCMYVRIT